MFMVYFNRETGRGRHAKPAGVAEMDGKGVVAWVGVISGPHGGSVGQWHSRRQAAQRSNSMARSVMHRMHSSVMVMIGASRRGGGRRLLPAVPVSRRRDVAVHPGRNGLSSHTTGLCRWPGRISRRCPARATYREILERRAKANGIDFVEGVATAISPIAFFETVMVKSYETLVDSNTKVDVNTGILAAGRLQSLIDSRDYEHELLLLKVQLAAICAAVRSTVPQEMWGEIIEKLDEADRHSEALDVGTDSFDDDDDEPYDTMEFIDEDDDEF